MSINPFKPPETDSTKNPRPPATPGSQLKAVLTGLAVDIGGSIVFGIAISVIYAIQLQGQGMSDEDLPDAMDNMPHDSALYIAGNLLGLLMSLLGGFVCARIARRGEYRAGLIMAALSAIFGLMMSPHADADEMTVLLTVTSVACNLLGVKYGAEHNRRVEAAADPAKDSSTP
jgi:hypothetical protein